MTTGLTDSTTADVDAACQAAAAAFPSWSRTTRAERAGVLAAMADALAARADEIVAIADQETSLGEPRLRGELVRTCYQMRFFGEVIEEGSYLEATIDHAGETPMGPRPDLRRMLVPIGPVGVFGASNFPLAFSVPGGDTVSALAAGCTVVIKAHPAHPLTSRLCFDTMAAVAPEGVLHLVSGEQAGRDLVEHPAHPGGRLHRISRRRTCAGRSRRGPAGPDPVLRRARQHQRHGGHPGGRHGARRRDRHRAGRLVHAWAAGSSAPSRGSSSSPRAPTAMHCATPAPRPYRTSRLPC